MPASIAIREFPSGISVRVRESRQAESALATLVAGSVFLYLVLHSKDKSQPYLLIVGSLCVVVILRDIVSALRDIAVELRVTNLELVSEGHAPEDNRPSTIARADIYDLEFREASGGPDGAELPKGLYVGNHRAGPGP